VPAVAQDKDVLSQLIVASVAKSDKEWKPSENKVLDGKGITDVDVVFIRFSSGASPIDMLILLYPSLNEAKKDYPRAFETTVDGPYAERKPLSTRISNLGDEYRVWQDPNTRITGIVFRKNKAVMQVEGPSLELVTKFALYAAREIDNAK
jgi:hypothetical protein